jgi:integrase
MQPPSGAHDHGNLIQNAAVAPFTTASPSALGKEADDYHASVRVDIKRGVHTSSNATVAQTGEKWIGDAEERLEPATVESYRQHLRDHIIPFIGAVKFSQLTVPGVRDYMDRLRADGRSPAMVKRVVGDLGSILADAQGRGLVAQNVVRSLMRV